MQTNSDAMEKGTYLKHLQQEIIERPQAETAFHDSEEPYHQLVQFSPDGMVVHKNGVIEFVIVLRSS
ncbi:MAG: hypothetical protein AABN95_08545 [Acidobacteriota bacterium]